MVEFNIGSSRIFGNGEGVAKGNIGVNFWGKDLFKFDQSVEDKANLLKAASNFIKILTGQDIPVRYSANGDDHSFTDGSVITISSEIMPECLDSTIGLALHEASHCAITSFTLLKEFIKKKNVPERYHEHIRYIKDIFNWIEDRRIDNWAYNQAPGYSKYYEVLYDRYFFSDRVTDVLKTKDLFKEESFENYKFFVFNSMHPDVEMNELEGLAEIKKIINLSHVSRWKSSRDTLRTAYEVFDIINKYAKKNKNEKPNDPLTKKISKELGEILKDQEGFLSGDIKKEKIGDSDIKKLKEYIKSEGKKGNDESTDDDFNYKIVIIDDITEDKIKLDLYHIFSTAKEPKSKSLIREGISLGSMLGRKLKMRTDEKSLKTVAQKSGRLNKRSLFSASYDNPRLFYVLKEESYKDIVVHMSIDMSGSMDGLKWERTLVSLVAIAKAISMVKGIRMQISLRYSNIQNEAILINFYDSVKDSLKKLNLFEYAAPLGGTPEGVCIGALINKDFKKLMNSSTLFINFSDGEPMMIGMTPEQGVKITKKVIDKLVKSGMLILSFFISENTVPKEKTINNFKTMYGNGAQFIDVKSMNHLTKAINNKLLKMGI